MASCKLRRSFEAITSQSKSSAARLQSLEVNFDLNELKVSIAAIGNELRLVPAVMK